MPATVSYSSQTTQLSIKISSTLTPIPGIVGFPLPDIAWDLDDITNLTSPNNFKEKKPIMKDPTPFSFDMIYDPADTAQEAVRAANNATLAPLTDFSITLSDTGAATVAFQGYVTKFQIKAEKGKSLMVTVEITPTGAVTFTP